MVNLDTGSRHYGGPMTRSKYVWSSYSNRRSLSSSVPRPARRWKIVVAAVVTSLMLLAVWQVSYCYYGETGSPMLDSTGLYLGTATKKRRSIWRSREKDNPRSISVSDILAKEKSSTPSSNAYYTPSTVEHYLLDHANSLGWNDTQTLHSTCHIWNDPDALPNATIYPQLRSYLQELQDYHRLIKAHPVVTDIRKQWLDNVTLSREDVCRQLDLHPLGLADGIFKNSRALSQMTRSGYVEPLLPPMRHPLYCVDGKKLPQEYFTHVLLKESTANKDYLMELGYLVQDFAATCRTQQMTTSRNILIDLGASLDFHIDRGDFVDIMKNPTVYLMEIFRKFGLPFDHIYAFEMTPIAPETVYAKLPKEFVHGYHWINLPVSSDVRSKLHPLQMILDQYNENDLVVVKLDIDTPHIEMALVEQLLQNDAYADLVDHFYFEHHVYLNEVAREWITMQDSVASSLQLFNVLRQKGIAAHYWP